MYDCFCTPEQMSHETTDAKWYLTARCTLGNHVPSDKLCVHFSFLYLNMWKTRQSLDPTGTLIPIVKFEALISPSTSANIEMNFWFLSLGINSYWNLSFVSVNNHLLGCVWITANIVCVCVVWLTSVSSGRKHSDTPGRKDVCRIKRG